MRFACFGYLNETEWDKIPEQEQESILNDYFNFYQQLKSQKMLLGGTGLKSVGTACKLSLKDNKIVEINLRPDKEQLGGFIIIEAKDLDEAKTIISKHPGLKVGDFEIRTIDEEITKIVGVN